MQGVGGTSEAGSGAKRRVVAWEPGSAPRLSACDAVLLLAGEVCL